MPLIEFIVSGPATIPLVKPSARADNPEEELKIGIYANRVCEPKTVYVADAVLIMLNE